MVRIVVRSVHVVTTQSVTTSLDHAHVNWVTWVMIVNKVRQVDTHMYDRHSLYGCRVSLSTLR